MFYSSNPLRHVDYIIKMTKYFWNNKYINSYMNIITGAGDSLIKISLK